MNHRIDAISIVERVRETFEDDRAHSFSYEQTISARVKWTNLLTP
jgi:hypothetical protein